MTPDSLTEEERAWLVADEALWRRARTIVARHPHLDPSGVYHTLRNLELAPVDRLRRGLAHGRLRPRRA